VTRDIPIRGEMIRLGQLLKLIGAVSGGGDVKPFLATQLVLVNGEPENRRGRQLRVGDEVRIGADLVRLVG
jgi:ribosome-associated protein